MSCSTLCLCVPGAEPLATAAKGFAIVLLTQPSEKGDRVISLRVVSKEVTKDSITDEYKPDMEGKPPRSDICFYESAE